MNKINPPALMLFGGIALIGLTGCEKLEQAANQAVEKAQQSAVKAIDEVRQAGSIEEARQSAVNALNAAKQDAAGLLGQASQLLAEDGQAQPAENPAADGSPDAI